MPKDVYKAQSSSSRAAPDYPVRPLRKERPLTPRAAVAGGGTARSDLQMALFFGGFAR